MLDEKPLRSGKADLHIHTQFSDGEPSVTQLLDHVANTDLSVIAITDHDTTVGAAVAQELARYRSYPFDVVVGEEVTTRDGHIVGLFLEEIVEPGRVPKPPSRRSMPRVASPSHPTHSSTSSRTARGRSGARWTV